MADETPPPAEERACAPCRGTGRIVSRLGGSASTVVCPWCAGTGRFVPGHDAQAEGAPADEPPDAAA
jgi:hypothetical protein